MFLAGCGSDETNPKVELATPANTHGAKPIGVSAAGGGKPAAQGGAQSVGSE